MLDENPCNSHLFGQPYFLSLCINPIVGSSQPYRLRALSPAEAAAAEGTLRFAIKERAYDVEYPSVPFYYEESTFVVTFKGTLHYLYGQKVHEDLYEFDGRDIASYTKEGAATYVPYTEDSVPVSFTTEGSGFRSSFAHGRCVRYFSWDEKLPEDRF